MCIEIQDVVVFVIIYEVVDDCDNGIGNICIYNKYDYLFRIYFIFN